MRGEFALARELLSEGTQVLEDLGPTVYATIPVQDSFLIERLAGTPEAATDALRNSYETLEGSGEKAFSSTIAGFLAHALCASADYEEAARFSRACEEAAAPDDVFSQILWRTSRAKIFARQGHLETAEVLAREAVSLAAATDLLSTHGDALSDLAEVLALAGRRQEALLALGQAANLYGAKGSVAGLGHARAAAEELALASPPA